VTVVVLWLQYAEQKMGPILLGALCPRTVARGTLVQGLAPDRI
jgi:hypothetical protein